MNTRFKVFASYNILQYLCAFIHVLIFVTVSKCRKSPKLTNIVIWSEALISNLHQWDYVGWYPNSRMLSSAGVVESCSSTSSPFAPVTQNETVRKKIAIQFVCISLIFLLDSEISCSGRTLSQICSVSFSLLRWISPCKCVQCQVLGEARAEHLSLSYSLHDLQSAADTVLCFFGNKQEASFLERPLRTTWATSFAYCLRL
jgi:hypothetical protein